MKISSTTPRTLAARHVSLALAVIALSFSLRPSCARAVQNDVVHPRITSSMVTRLAAPNRTGLCGRKTTFEAVLTLGSGSPLTGVEILFDSPRLFHASKMTDSNGRATYEYVFGDHQKAGDYTVGVSFGGTGGDQGLQPSKASATFVVAKAPTSISISDLQTSRPGIFVSIQLVREHDQKKISGNVAVKVNGALFKTVSEPLTNITPPGAGPWTIECQFVGDDSYLPSSASKTVHR